jgi:hypothetical protein
VFLSVYNLFYGKIWFFFWFWFWLWFHAAHVQHFYGYHEAFVGKVTSYDPVDQYYTVQYVDDDDVEEYDEFELTQMVLRDKNGDDQDGASKCSIVKQQQHQPKKKTPHPSKKPEQLAFPVLVFSWYGW